jgi:hypothetical protein
MQSSDFEKLVEAFLLYDRSTLVAPQFLLRVAGKDRFVDVLAIHLRQRSFFLVEVTENRNPRTLAPTIKEFTDHAAWIATRLKLDFGLGGEWKAIPWIFIRRDAGEAFAKALSGIAYKRNFIEELLERRADPSQMLNEKTWGPLAEKAQ